jgi:cell wall-associated NlpC family hydrolase
MKHWKILSTLFFLTALAGSALAIPAPVSPAAAGERQAAAASHRVRKGESLYAIARRAGLSVEELKRLNNLKGDAIKPGQMLRLAPPATRVKTAAGPSSSQPAPAPAKTGRPRTHVVKKGESLYRIARQAGLSVEELKRLNGLKGNALKPGQSLIIGRNTGGAPASVIASTPDAAELLRREAQGKPDETELLSLADLPGAAPPEELQKVAFAFLSTPYRFGGSSRQGTDCSGFVQQVFRELDIDLPRSAREQYRVGVEIPSNELRSGDLLFFRTYARYPSHVGIYLGDGKMIHASPRSRRVVVTDIGTPYFSKRYIGAKRVALLAPGSLNFDTLAEGVEVETIEESDAEQLSAGEEGAAPTGAEAAAGGE